MMQDGMLVMIHFKNEAVFERVPEGCYPAGSYGRKNELEWFRNFLLQTTLRPIGIPMQDKKWVTSEVNLLLEVTDRSMDIDGCNTAFSYGEI